MMEASENREYEKHLKVFNNKVLGKSKESNIVLYGLKEYNVCQEN